mgnify:CR=1 FL=1
MVEGYYGLLDESGVEDDALLKTQFDGQRRFFSNSSSFSVPPNGVFAVRFCVANRQLQKEACGTAPAPAEAASHTLLKEQLSEVLQTLTPREEKVLRLRFGLELIVSTICTGIRMVRAWSAIARVIACRIHQVA